MLRLTLKLGYEGDTGYMEHSTGHETCYGHGMTLTMWKLNTGTFTRRPFLHKNNVHDAFKTTQTILMFDGLT